MTWGICIRTGSQRYRIIGINAEVTYKLKKGMHGKHSIFFSVCGEMRRHLRPLVKETSPGEAARLKRGKKAVKMVISWGRRMALD